MIMMRNPGFLKLPSRLPCIRWGCPGRKTGRQDVRLSEEEGRTTVVEETITWVPQEPSRQARSAEADRRLPEVQEEETRSRPGKIVRSKGARSWRSAPQRAGRDGRGKLSAVLRKARKPPDGRKRNAVRRSRRRSTANVPAPKPGPQHPGSGRGGRRWRLELESLDDMLDTNNLMIEAETDEEGLSMAVNSLKEIHRELGIKNPVAKIQR